VTPTDGVRILIPCHNGGDRLAAVLRGLEPLGIPVLVVDDGSTDGSGEAARGLGAGVLRLPVRSGKGSAVRRGLEPLLSRTDTRWVIFMDGDGQHVPSEVPRFLESMEDADFLIGSRMEEAGNFPRHRLLTNRAGSGILRLMSGHAVPDTQCGFRGARADLLRAMALESSGFEIETEMLLKALRLGARWRAVPISAVYEDQGSHFLPVADTFRICMAALRYVGG
jgi:glycosyltransferase involved in cell wall biosynthesis